MTGHHGKSQCAIYKDLKMEHVSSLSVLDCAKRCEVAARHTGVKEQGLLSISSNWRVRW